MTRRPCGRSVQATLGCSVPSAVTSGDKRKNVDVNISVGSCSAAKIDAVSLAVEAVWPDKSYKLAAIGADSGVENQPLTDAVTCQGALNRAWAALGVPDTDYSFGLESGLHLYGARWMNTGWVVVVGRDGTIGVASTIRMSVPTRLVEYVLAGREMSEACQLTYGVVDGKVHGQGHFEIMTNQLLSRTSAYRDACIAALGDLMQTRDGLRSHEGIRDAGFSIKGTSGLPGSTWRFGSTTG